VVSFSSLFFNGFLKFERARADYRLNNDNLFYSTEPYQPLGLSDGRIPDNRITASSVFDGNFPPYRARLHWTKYGIAQAWASKTLDVNQWLQIDLYTMHYVTALATQGRHGHPQWVKSYWFSYSNDGTTFIEHKDQNQARKVITKELFPRGTHIKSR